MFCRILRKKVVRIYNDEQREKLQIKRLQLFIINSIIYIFKKLGKGVYDIYSIYRIKNKMEKKLPVCENTIIHKEIIENVKTKIPEEEVLYDLGDFFKLLGDSTRIKILSALFHSEMCVCDIASLFEMTQSAISHQLRVLKQGRLVKYRKSGKVVYYSLDDEHIKKIVEQGLTHILEKG